MLLFSFSSIFFFYNPICYLVFKQLYNISCPFFIILYIYYFFYQEFPCSPFLNSTFCSIFSMKFSYYTRCSFCACQPCFKKSVLHCLMLVIPLFIFCLLLSKLEVKSFLCIVCLLFNAIVTMSFTRKK